MRFSRSKDNEEPTPIEPLKILHTEKNAHDILFRKLTSMINDVPYQSKIVVVCVGTDRSTGDCLGPLVGTQLAKRTIPSIDIYGTLDQPVHAMNLQETLNLLYETYTDPFIIAIDACLGQLTSVGCIQVGYGPVKPGAGVNKELPAVGNMHITGIVNVGGFMEYFVLQNTRLSLVMSMAEVIADAIHSATSHVRNISTTSFLRFEQ